MQQHADRILPLYFSPEEVENGDLRAYVEEWRRFLFQHRRTLLKHVNPSTLEVFLSYRELLARSPPPSAGACAAALRASPQDVLNTIACGAHLAVLHDREEREKAANGALLFATLGCGEAETRAAQDCVPDKPYQAASALDGDILVGGGEIEEERTGRGVALHSRRIWIRLLGFGPLTSLSILRSRQVGSLVAVRGRVLRVYEPRPLVTELPFVCARCGARFVRQCVEGRVSHPGPCPTPRCYSRHFLPQRREAATVDWQKLCLQAEDTVVAQPRREEKSEESASHALPGREDAAAAGDARSSRGAGDDSQQAASRHDEKEEKERLSAQNELRRPASVDCEVRGSLVNGCRLGEKIVVVGIVRAYQAAGLNLPGRALPEAARARVPGPGKSLFTLYLDVVSLASASPERQRSRVQRRQQAQHAIYAEFPRALRSLTLDGPLAEMAAEDCPWRDFTAAPGAGDRARPSLAGWKRRRRGEAAGASARNGVGKTEEKGKDGAQTCARNDAERRPQDDSGAAEGAGCTYTASAGEEGSASPAKSEVLDEAFPAYPGDPDFEETDSHVAMQQLEFITEIFEKEEGRLELLAASLAPHIRGHEVSKAALVLTLLGGVSVYGDGEGSSEAAGGGDAEAPPGVPQVAFDGKALKRRGSIHLLLMGDAGVGKSRLLRATAEAGAFANAGISSAVLRYAGLSAACSRPASERDEEDEDEIGPGGSVFVCGNSASAAGLTASTYREPGTGEFALEAGALVLADGGICCVDELDKMHAASTSADISALLEAMEHQTVSVAKGSCHCTLPARTALAAAANPKDGKFQASKTLAENVKLPPCLTSRFDLIICLHDEAGSDTDPFPAYATRRRSDLDPRDSEHPRPSLSGRKGAQSQSLAERIRAVKPAKLLPLSLMQAYLAYARQYVRPVLTPEAGEALKRLYAFLRRQEDSEFAAHDSLPVGMRQLESLIRFCEARARADLVNEVTEAHVRDVGNIFVNSAAFSRLAYAASPAAQAEAACLALYPAGGRQLNPTCATTAAQLVAIAAGKKGRKRKSLAGLVPSFLQACILFLSNNPCAGLTNRQLLDCATVVVSRADSTACPEALVALANEGGYILRKADGLWQVDRAFGASAF
ncbi:MCM2/3/5 family protein [Besnoitia besnoiti]|uniref:DNA helicase n=1 Tax=Besnoitia besnoiti TaxID=94643 RepID=A0A2A9M6R5_BESBE|nr:MCM2/3/5 family protein [Besnoitia besnoiti]PFH33685.1 MCM2/3/5 family protein [Besnoitia besnoiti]